MSFGPLLCTPSAPTLWASGSEPLVRGMACTCGSVEHELRRRESRRPAATLTGGTSVAHDRRCRGPRHLGPRHVSRTRRPGGPPTAVRLDRNHSSLRSGPICSSLPPAPRGGDSHATAPLARRVRLPARGTLAGSTHGRPSHLGPRAVGSRPRRHDRPPVVDIDEGPRCRHVGAARALADSKTRRRPGPQSREWRSEHLRRFLAPSA